MLKDLEKESIQVTIRVRPFSEKEALEDSRTCIRPDTTAQVISLLNGNESKTFAFDSIVGSADDQQSIFHKVGMGSTSHCLEGYNCSIFAYGQTGSGKTYTMMGVGQEDSDTYDQRGLIPRTLEHLFFCIDRETQESRTQYLVKCTFLEIYNEAIIDLLDKNNINLQIREDLKKGVYVEGLYEETISKSEEALQLLRRGSKGRHVGSTYYNETSSRSHSVFTLLLQSRLVKNGVVNLKVRKFHFIDLAGSERTRHSNGERLKEGCSINKSLHVLGMVINSLVEATEGKTKHINYRDSKLTFLLKDALGGNSKTHLIANISPGQTTYAETLSTLNFARRVKLIKLNKASINEDASGNLEALKSQILRLKQQIMGLRSNANIMSSGSMMLNKEMMGGCPVQVELERIIVKSDGHLGMEKMLKEYIEESIEKETKFEVQLLKRDEKIFKLQEAMGQFTKNEIHLRMIIELYERRFSRMKALQSDINKLGHGLEQNSLKNFFEVERDTLHNEVSQLRELLKETPFLKALIKENHILKDEAKNPQELSQLLGANMKFLAELRQELTYSIKEREELNNVIETYAMEKSSNKDIASPRKQQQLQNELRSKDKDYQESIEQLELEVAFLKSTLEDNDLVLKESVEREILLEEKVTDFEKRVQELDRKAKEAEKVESLEAQIMERMAREEELQSNLNAANRELAILNEDLNRQVAKVTELKWNESSLCEQLAKSGEMLVNAQHDHKEKMSSLSKLARESEEEKKQLNGLLIQTQELLLSERQTHEKLIESKNTELSEVVCVIEELKRGNSCHLAIIESLREQVEKEASASAQSLEELNQKMEKARRQLQNEKNQIRMREEELQSRMKEKMCNEDEANKRLTALNIELINKQSKLAENRQEYQKSLESLQEEIMRVTHNLHETDNTLTHKVRALEEMRLKEEDMHNMLKITKEQLKNASEQSSLKEHESITAINSLQSSVSSLQSRLKEAQTLLTSTEQQLSATKEDLFRKEKQIERVKQAHLKEMEMLREEGAEFKQRVETHEVTMKQIFDQSLNNKEKVILQLKALYTTQLAEEKKKLEEDVVQLGEAEDRIKELQQVLETKESTIDEKDRNIDSLTDQLNHQLNQHQMRSEEVEMAHNEFIDRKNEEIESLESTILSLQGQISQGKSLEAENQKQIHQLQHKMEQLEAQLDLVSQEKHSIQQQYSSLVDSNSLLEESINAVIAEKDGLLKLPNQLQEEKSELFNEVSTLKEQLDKWSHLYQQQKGITSDYESRLTASTSSVEASQEQITTITVQLQSVRGELLRVRGELEIKMEWLDKVENEVVSLRLELEQAQHQLSHIQRQREEEKRNLQDIHKRRVNDVLQQNQQLCEQIQRITCQNQSINFDLGRVQQDLGRVQQQNHYLDQEMDKLRTECALQIETVEELKREMRLLAEGSQDTQVQSQKQQHLISTQQQDNQELKGAVGEYKQQIMDLREEIVELRQGVNDLENNLSESESRCHSLGASIEAGSQSLLEQKQLSEERLELLQNVQAQMETFKRTELEAIKSELKSGFQLERQALIGERQSNERIHQETLADNKTLSQKNLSLECMTQQIKERVKFMEEEVGKEVEKGINLKRLIENLERQKQQLEKELTEKETSYKRLLSKICKDEQPRKASEDKKSMQKTSELLEKSRLQLLQSKKVAEEYCRQVKKLKTEMQTKEEHYLNIHQKAEEYCKAQEARLSEMKASHSRLETEHTELLREIERFSHLSAQNQSLMDELSGHRQYKDKNEKKREDLELTIKTLSEDLEVVKNQLEGRSSTLHRGQDEKLIFINKLKEENSLLKREKHTLSEEVTRLRRENQVLLEKLSQEAEEKLRLKSLNQRRGQKEPGHSTNDIGIKIELQRKQVEVRYLQEGYAELCTVLNIKRQLETKSRGESTLGLIKQAVEELSEEVVMLRALNNKDKERESKNLRMDALSRDFSHLRSKENKKNPLSQESGLNPLKWVMQETNKIGVEEYSSFEDIRNQAIKLRDQSKLQKDRLDKF